MSKRLKKSEDWFACTARGLQCKLYRCGALAHYPEEDVWFILLGELHKDPFRFLSVDEVLENMEVSFNRRLSAEERLRYMDTVLWEHRRKENMDAAPAHGWAFIEEHAFVPKRSLMTAWREGYKEGARAMQHAHQAKANLSLSKMSILLGQRTTRKLVQHLNNDVYGVPANVGTVRVRSTSKAVKGMFAEAVQAAAYRVPSLPLPSHAARMLVELEQVPRALVITLYGVPVSVPQDSLEEQIRTAGISWRRFVPVRKGARFQSFSVVMGDAATVQNLLDTKIVAVADDKYFTVRKYPHRHDSQDDRFGRACNPLALLKYLGAEYPNGQTPNDIVCIFEDGVSASSHFVLGYLWRVGTHPGPRGLVYSLQGSEADSSVMNLSWAFVAQAVSRSEQSAYAGAAILGDASMAFEKFGVRGGNLGHRSPYVEIHSAFHAVQFYGPSRTFRSLFLHAQALLAVFVDLSSYLASEHDVCDSDLKRLLKAAKCVMSRGVVNLPYMLQCSAVWDPWCKPANVRAIRLWQRAREMEAPEAVVEAFVWINGRTALPINEMGMLDLRAFVPSGATINVLDESGTPVSRSATGLFGPVRPASIVFVSHSYTINPDRLVAIPGSLHGAALEASDLLLQQVVRTLIPGGEVAGKSTAGMSASDMESKIVDPLVNSFLGGAKKTHSYTNGAQKFPIFDRWKEVFGAVTHPVFAPVIELWRDYLLARVTRDATLCDDERRYSLYFMLLIVAPLVGLSELAEESRRRQESAGCVREYLLVRGFGAAMEAVKPIVCVDDSALASKQQALLEKIEAAIKGGEPAANVSKLAEKLKRKQAKEKTYRGMVSLKLSAIACALPRALGQVNTLARRRHLLWWLSEDQNEHDLKSAKALVNSSNGRNHLNEMGFVAAAQGHAHQAQTAPAQAPIYRGRVREVRLAPCWLHYLPVAAWNTAEAVALMVELKLEAFVRVFEMPYQGVPSAAGMSFLVGDAADGEVLVLCACGNVHHQQAASDLPESQMVALPQTMGGASMVVQRLRHAQPTMPPVPPVVETVPGVLKEIREKALKRKKVREEHEQQADAERKCAELLVLLGFLKTADDEITDDVLKAFRKVQRHTLFLGNTPNEWPQGRLQRIRHLAHRVNESWQSKK